MGRYIVKIDDFDQFMSKMENVATSATTSRFEGIENKAKLISKLKLPIFQRIKWFFYCDNDDGNTIRLYDNEFYKNNEELYLPKGQIQYDKFQYLLFRGHNLGKAKEEVKENIRKCFQEIYAPPKGVSCTGDSGISLKYFEELNRGPINPYAIEEANPELNIAQETMQKDKIISYPETPTAIDINEPLEPERVLSTVYRVLRDTELTRKIKFLYAYQCQICGETVELFNGERYAEAHHIKPLGFPHSGPDVSENIICVCPNHHVQLDYGSIKLEKSKLQWNHEIGEEYLSYHNEKIYKLYQENATRWS